MKDLEDKEDLMCILRIHKFILYTACIKCIIVHFRHVWSFKWSNLLFTRLASFNAHGFV